MSFPKPNYPHQQPGDIGDLFIDGYDVLRWDSTPDASTAQLTNLRTGEPVRLDLKRLAHMRLLAPGAVIDTGAESHHILDVDAQGNVRYTHGAGGDEHVAHAVVYAGNLAVLRANAYGKKGERKHDDDLRVDTVRRLLREAKFEYTSLNTDPDRSRNAVIIRRHDGFKVNMSASVDGAIVVEGLPDALEVKAAGGGWVAVYVKMDAAQAEVDAFPVDADSSGNGIPDDVDFDDGQENCSECGKPLNNDDDVCNDCLLGRALRAHGDPLIADMDAAADRLLDEFSQPDDEPTDAEIEARVDAEEAGAADRAPIYRKGDQFYAADGTRYQVIYASERHVRMECDLGGVVADISVRQEDVPALLTRKAQVAERRAAGWGDVVVELSTANLALQERLRAAERELARLHALDHDTEPIMPEVIEEAVRASQEMAQVDVIGWEDTRVESKTLEPEDITAPGDRDARDKEIARLRNDGWFVVFETAAPIVEATDTFAGQRVAIYHTVRLERRVEDDDDSGGDSEHRDVLDQAREVLGDDTDDLLLDADAEDADQTLQPALLTRDMPLTDAIRRVGVEGVREFLNAQVCETFGLALAGSPGEGGRS